MVGVELSGRYLLEERLAGGGMGSVYAARDERLGRRVAVKVLKEDLAAEPDFVERFRREARAVAALVHPNIANVFDYGEDGDRHYIVMELVEGRDLARLLRDEGRPPIGRAIPITSQLCDALGHAHSAGVVHRDVKPANVIVDPSDRVRVTDFGIARAQGDATLTGAGSVLGTAQYISPEQASGGEIGPASDVYSTGIVLYEVLTGTAPFTAESPISLALRHVNENVPAPSAADPRVPRELDGVVGRATAKAPGDRYANGNDMAAALRNLEVYREPTRGAIAAPTAVLASGAEPTTTMGPSTDRFSDVVWPAGARTSARGVRFALIGFFLALLLTAAGLVASTALRDEPGGRQRERRSAASQPGQQPTENAPSPSPSATVEQVTVPGGLVGSNAQAASNVLRREGFVVSIALEPSSEVKEGFVISVAPSEGETVPAGSTVTLTVSSGSDEETPPPEQGDGHGEGDGEGEG
jgi:hypothetical protein